MNINRTSNRAPFRTTRSTSSCAKMANSISARDGKQNSFEEVLKQSTSARDSFNGVSSAERTPTKEIVSSVQDTQAKLDKISAAINDMDYSGMSKAEIYADIEKRYENVFDDFHMTMAVWPSEYHCMVHNHFLEDINNHLGSQLIPRNLIQEARGYSNMSYDEIEVSIKEKYAGKTGFVDQLNLFGELFSSGVLTNKFGWDEATKMSSELTASLDCGGDGRISKSEWLSRIEQTGASSPFSLLLNNPYFAKDKELFKTMIDEILFGITDKK